MTIIDKEKELFTEWSKVRDRFSPDGIIDEKSYLDSNPKLLFLLKEVNSKNGFDLREFIREGARDQTWGNIARWVHGIRNCNREIEWKELQQIKTNEQRFELLKYICVMNLKKSTGGHTTNVDELRKTAIEDKDFLYKQFQIYFTSETTQPDFIIACGSVTSETFNRVIKIRNESKWKSTKRGISYYEFDTGRFFINFSHPAARIEDSLLYYGLIDAIKEIMTEKNRAQHCL